MTAFLPVAARRSHGEVIQVAWLRVEDLALQRNDCVILLFFKARKQMHLFIPYGVRSILLAVVHSKAKEDKHSDYIWYCSNIPQTRSELLHSHERLSEILN